jgi:hypothetical protein
MGSEWAKVQAKDPNVNIRTPIWKTRRNPTISPMAAIGSSETTIAS